LLDDLDIIDPHHHFWDLAQSYPWLEGPVNIERFTGDDSAIRKNYLPAEYRSDFSSLRLIGSIHVDAGAGDGLAEARWLQQVHISQGLPSAVVAGVSLWTQTSRSGSTRWHSCP
jgi:predicted TIM-barrel fold metal-dependent hydrolase